MTQLDLLTYPAVPGSKVSGPSQQAAEAMKPTAATLRAHVMAVLERGDKTADEVAGAMRESVLSVRPRLSELHTLGAIEDSGVRRPNSSGRNATVWRAKP